MRFGSKDGDAAPDLGLMRSLAWAAMTLSVVLSVMVAMYLGNYGGTALIRKNHNFSALLGDYLNNQVYRRFTLPTVSIFGRVDLNNPEQYRALDQIIRSIIQDLNVDDLRIYSQDKSVRYATSQEEVGRADLASPSVDAALTATGPIFDIEEEIPYWQALFRLSLEPETFRMRTTYPLHMESSPFSSAPGGGGLLGVLEFSQDISRDMESTIRFQQLVLTATLLSNGMLLIVLLFLVRRAERALALRMSEAQRLQAELHQHEKLAGMGRVVASIAHEIRNPLGIISSSAELLIKRQDSSPGTRRILEAIYDEARRLTRTVGDFLDYARPRQPKHDNVDLNNVITQALAFLGPEMTEREIGVVRSGLLDELQIPGDKDLLYRAFYNIMGNALQAMGRYGTLTISTSVQDGNAVLLFHDSGGGFPAESMKQLLDPFFTTKDDGTGLGLPIVNTIISSHGGSLELCNPPGGGAEVRVTLPGAQAGISEAPGA